MTRIIADIKDQADADTIFRVIKKFNARVRKMDDQQWEDYVLGIIAQDAEKSRDVSGMEVSKIFRRHGIAF